MPNQRYVSEELTHFAGRTSTTEDERFELLVAILREGRLRSPLADRFAMNGDLEPIGTKGARFVSWSPNNDLRRMYTATVVCFCDIPVEDFAIHMRKYSHFGLAFNRGYLLERGASPVLYLPADAIDVASGEPFEKAFTDGARATIKHINDMMSSGVEGDSAKALEISQFVNVRLMPLIKPFDAKLPEDHVDNYYMEREWRVHGEVEFELKDVRRVIIPEAYAERFRNEFPDYFGQVTFAT